LYPLGGNCFWMLAVGVRGGLGGDRDGSRGGVAVGFVGHVGGPGVGRAQAGVEASGGRRSVLPKRGQLPEGRREKRDGFLVIGAVADRDSILRVAPPCPSGRTPGRPKTQGQPER